MVHVKKNIPDSMYQGLSDEALPSEDAAKLIKNP
jgi:hypothetical protein